MAQTCNFIKKEILTQVFPSEFCEIFKNTFFYRTPPVAGPGVTTLWRPDIKGLKVWLNSCRLHMFFLIGDLRILQYSQENTCAGSLFNKVVGLWTLQNF